MCPQQGRWVWCALWLLALPALVALAQPNLCTYRYDGECDEAAEGGLCALGTDTWDCRRTGPPPSAESCIYSRDGECDEPGGTGLCIPLTDTSDCRAQGVEQLAVFFGTDDRLWPNSSEFPWRAIGRVELASGGYCTGALVGRRLVLTAAHCLHLSAEPGGVDPALLFRAGVSGSSTQGEAAVIDSVAPAEFDIDRFLAGSSVDRHDWAILVLARPLGDALGWLDVRPLRPKELEGWLQDKRRVLQGGYSYDAAEFLSANIGCRLVEMRADNTILHRCDTLGGDSGSPIFLADGGRYRLIALDSAVYPAEAGGYPRNLAVDARAFAKAVERQRQAGQQD